MIILDYETDNGQRGLGDVLISTPIIQALSEKFCTRIDIVLREKAQPLLYRNPYVKNIYPTLNGLESTLHLIMGMKLEDYSNPRNRQPRVDSIAALCGVELRDKMPQLYYPQQDKIPRSIGVAIESNSNVRTWRYEYVTELVESIEADWHVFGLNYVELSPKINNHLGKLTLAETIEYVSKMEKFVTVDSFFSHLTAALNMQSIILYTTISSEWRAKYYSQAKVIQSPKSCSPCMDRQQIKQIKGECDDSCVDAITVERVKALL